MNVLGSAGPLGLGVHVSPLLPWAGEEQMEHMFQSNVICEDACVGGQARAAEPLASSAGKAGPDQRPLAGAPGAHPRQQALRTTESSLTFYLKK